MPTPKEKTISFGRRRSLYTSSEGRQNLPDLLLQTYGDKTVIGFHRYKRPLGAIVPIEAVQMLAGREDEVDKDTQKRVQRTAQILLDQLTFSDEYAELSLEHDDLTSIDEIAKSRTRRRPRPKKAKAKAKKRPTRV